MASEREQWERVQTKTFTNWVNSHLIKRGRKINDLETDLRSGVELINLLEVRRRAPSNTPTAPTNGSPSHRRSRYPPPLPSFS